MNPNQDFADALRTAFASHYSFGLKAQHAHWNVQGRMFAQDHALFARIYDEVGGTTDAFAENLRKSQVMVPASIGQIGQLSVVEDFTADAQSAEEMLNTLLADSDKLAGLFAAMVEIAERQNEYGLANYFADRQDAYRQHSWMLRASVNG